MSETAFPVNDLFRRKIQTSLTFISLTTCVAATFFLLLLSDQISSGIVAANQNTLTVGFLNIFNQFLFFVGILVFVVGAVIVSCIVFLMTKQRTRDFGLMKAIGCPNGLIFGYFFTEIILLTSTGCILGIILGFVMDHVVITMGGFALVQQAPNLWYAPLVFVAFFVFSLIFGAKPMFETARMSPVKSMSSLQYFGLSKTNKFKALSNYRLTFNLATRSLFRRQASTIRLVVFLSLVFTLLTVSIAGSIIARDTTNSWIERANGKNVVLIAHKDMSGKYLEMLTKFSGDTLDSSDFDYLNSKMSLPEILLQQLSTMPEVKSIDPRIVYYDEIQEVRSYTFDPETLATIPVGDSREGKALIIGVDPQKVTATWFVKGQFLDKNNFEAVVGDSTANNIYSADSDKKISVSDPLLQGVRVLGESFSIIGVCIDPINNGFVVYVPIEKLANLTSFYQPNVLLLQLESSVNHSACIPNLQEAVESIDPDLTIVDLNNVLQKNMDYLGSRWAAVILVPLLCLTASIFSLIAFLMMTIEEQNQEFAVLRATGMKQKTVVKILGAQSLFVLLSSFFAGISIGTIITLLILMREPLITGFTILQISEWLLSALGFMLLASLYPALKFAKKPLTELMS